MMRIDRSHYSLMAAICASLFSTPLMMAGVNAALPEIGAGFQASAAQMGLVGSAYSLGLAVFQLSAGSLGDIHGHRRIFLWGCVIFCLSSAFAGFCAHLPVFLGLRFVQGLGGALLSASGLALLASAAGPENRPAYLGMSGAAVYAGIAAGPPVAGLIVGSLGWRWLFWLNGLACVAVWLLMKYASSHEWRPASSRHFDWQGCCLYAVAMAALTIASILLSSSLLRGALALAVFAGGIALFLWREGRADFPVLDLRLLKANRKLRFSSLAAFVNYASFFGLIFYFSFYLQVAKGMTVQEAGLILSIQALAQICATQPAARLCSSWGRNAVCALGAGLCGLGLCAAAFLTPQNPLWILILTQILLGFGISAFALANTAIILDSAGPAVGQASALTGSMRTAGQLCGMIFITLTLSCFLGRQPVSPTTLSQFTTSMRLDLILFGALNLLAIGCVFFRSGGKDKEEAAGGD